MVFELFHSVSLAAALLQSRSEKAGQTSKLIQAKNFTFDSADCCCSQKDANVQLFLTVMCGTWFQVASLLELLNCALASFGKPLLFLFGRYALDLQSSSVCTHVPHAPKGDAPCFVKAE